MLELILYFGPVILRFLKAHHNSGYESPCRSRLLFPLVQKEPRVLVGRAGLKLPFFEQLDKLYLGQITVDIKTVNFPTNDFINVMVDVAKLCVADDLKLHMRNFK